MMILKPMRKLSRSRTWIGRIAPWSRRRLSMLTPAQHMVRHPAAIRSGVFIRVRRARVERQERQFLRSCGCRSNSPRRTGPLPRGFTLVELLIVVVILGILAAIVVPQYTNASGDAKLSKITSDLQMVRRQIGLYRAQHNGAYPRLTEFTAQMAGKTNADGSTTGAPDLGPYLNVVPINPFTNDNAVGTGSVGTSSWYYDQDTGRFRVNCHAAHSTL